AAKDEIRSGPRDFESGTLQEVPSKHPADDDLEIPTAYRLAVFAFESDEFRASGFVALAHQNLIESRPYIGASVALQRAQQICASDRVAPMRMRARQTILVAYAPQIFRRSHAPER